MADSTRGNVPLKKLSDNLTLPIVLLVNREECPFFEGVTLVEGGNAEDIVGDYLVIAEYGQRRELVIKKMNRRPPVVRKKKLTEQMPAESDLDEPFQKFGEEKFVPSRRILDRGPRRYFSASAGAGAITQTSSGHLASSEAGNREPAAASGSTADQSKSLLPPVNFANAGRRSRRRH